MGRHGCTGNLCVELITRFRSEEVIGWGYWHKKDKEENIL